MTRQPIDIELARTAKETAKRELAGRLDHVSSVGITMQDDSYAIQVNLEEELENLDSLPCEIEGVPVLYRVVGKVAKQ